ncbi:hypothetical protein VB737_05145, partial [Synechococcus sp. BA-120 BA3]|nr:hypothetical protein [Synechococcus sp. BA-120 BA3]
LVAGGLAGALGGQALAPHLSDRHLRQGFAALLVGSALLTGAEALQRQRSATATRETTLRSAIPFTPAVSPQR